MTNDTSRLTHDNARYLSSISIIDSISIVVCSGTARCGGVGLQSRTPQLPLCLVARFIGEGNESLPTSHVRMRWRLAARPRVVWDASHGHANGAAPQRAALRATTWMSPLAFVLCHDQVPTLYVSGGSGAGLLALLGVLRSAERASTLKARTACLDIREHARSKHASSESHHMHSSKVRCEPTWCNRVDHHSIVRQVLLRNSRSRLRTQPSDDILPSLPVPHYRSHIACSPPVLFPFSPDEVVLRPRICCS